MKYGDYLGTAISQHMTSKYLTKSLTHLLQARIVEVIMYDCPVLVSSARSSISKPLIEIYIFEPRRSIPSSRRLPPLPRRSTTSPRRSIASSRRSPTSPRRSTRSSRR